MSQPINNTAIKPPAPKESSTKAPEASKDKPTTETATLNEQFELRISTGHFYTDTWRTKPSTLLRLLDGGEDLEDGDYVIVRYRRTKSGKKVKKAKELVHVIVFGYCRKNIPLDVIMEIIFKYVWRNLFHFRRAVMKGFPPEESPEEATDAFTSEDELDQQWDKEEHERMVAKYGEHYIDDEEYYYQLERREQDIQAGDYDDDYYD